MPKFTGMILISVFITLTIISHVFVLRLVSRDLRTASAISTLVPISFVIVVTVIVIGLRIAFVLFHIIVEALRKICDELTAQFHC